jgi:hypothetical protein
MQNKDKDMNTDRGKVVPAQIVLEGVTAKKGILVFNSLETFEKAYPAILHMDMAQSALWEKNIGFVSQRNIFNQIVNAEYDYLAKPFDNKSERQLRKMVAPKGHTNIYQQHLRSGVIAPQKIDGEEETYDYSLSDKSYVPIVNAKGFFIVGDTIYQVKDGLTKEMKGADLPRLSLLDKAKSDDGTGKIKVRPTFNASPADVAAASAGLAGCSFPLTSNWVTNGSRRGITTVTLALSYWNPFPYKKVTITHNVFVQSQKKNFFGTWVYATCPNECWIGGTWTMNFDFMSAATLGYVYTNYYPRSYSYPHPNCINNFQASINPVTGGTAPYPSSFVFTAPIGTAFLGVRLTPVHWSVSVPGGASGIACGVSCS